MALEMSCTVAVFARTATIVSLGGNNAQQCHIAFLYLVAAFVASGTDMFGLTTRSSTPWGCKSGGRSSNALPLDRPRPFSFVTQANIEVFVPFMVTGALCSHVLQAVPCVFIPLECVGHLDRVSMADGAVAAERRRGIAQQFTWHEAQ